MSSFLSAAWGADTPTAPIWLMRQAGRYLPEYRKLKERYGFWRMCRTPEIAAEITLQPVRRFPLDAAILFNDIMTPLPPMGVDIDFDPGPVIRQPIRTLEAVRRLRAPASDEVAPFVADAIRLIRQESRSLVVSAPVVRELRPQRDDRGLDVLACPRPLGGADLRFSLRPAAGDEEELGMP